MKAFLIALLAGCNFGGTARPSADAAPPIDVVGLVDAPRAKSVFDPTIEKVTVEIDYETGQEPFTGAVASFGDAFDITVFNIDRLFAHKKVLTIPRTVAAMQAIGNIADEELTINDVVAIAQQHRNLHDSPTEKTYYILFVSGHFADQDGPHIDVLGYSIGGTGVIVMFKDVMRSSSILPNVQRFVEQSTITHELGHSIGLVDNGVPMTSAHNDAAHGAHCTDQSCVMYWQNEGAGAMATYVTQYVLTNNSILFKDECLADVDALTGGP